MLKLYLYAVFFQYTIRMGNTQYTPRSDLRFIDRNMIERPTTVKIDYSLHTKDPDSFWKGANLYLYHLFFNGKLN